METARVKAEDTDSRVRDLLKKHAERTITAAERKELNAHLVKRYGVFTAIPGYPCLQDGCKNHNLAVTRRGVAVCPFHGGGCGKETE